MTAPIGRRLLDTATAIASAATVIVGVACIDERTRRFLAQAVHGDVQVSVPVPDIRIHSMLRMAADIVGRDHLEIAVFAIACFVLFLMMFRL
jgi:hypothetical protein